MTPPRCECAVAGFCRRHKVSKVPHWHHLCNTRADYFARWEQGRGPGQHRGKPASAPPPLPPGMVRRLWNLASSLTAFVADGCKTVDQAEYSRRLAICDACDQRSEDVCTACGCFISAKAKARVMVCPLGKWAASIESLQEKPQ